MNTVHSKDNRLPIAYTGGATPDRKYFTPAYANNQEVSWQKASLLHLTNNHFNNLVI